MSFYRPHARVPAPVGDDVVTKQSFKDECDINNILAKYRATGIVQHIRADAARGAFLDVPDVVDFQQAMHIVMAAQETFQALPSAVRLEFNNDPEQFLAAFTDEAALPRLRELGLVQPPVEPSTGSPAPAREQAGEPVDGSS